MLTLDALLSDESLRQQEFPVIKDSLFLGHAGVTILPRRVTRTMQDYLEQCCLRMQEYPEAWKAVNETRVVAAELIGAKASEIALIGPTSVGLSLVANGLPWQAGDEVVCYLDDYPANVYPWTDLERHGVVLKRLLPAAPGAITPELVEAALTPKTKLVALASCHFLSGYRIEIDRIGRMLRERGILFCLDAIQTVGAFETRVDHVDFLSADSHKWMLGPMSAGIFYVREELQDMLRPSLLGSWNVQSPNFIAQEEIAFERGGRRYEPGALNISGILGMKAGIDLIQEIGLPAISTQLLKLKARLHAGLQPLGFTFLGPDPQSINASCITTVQHPHRPLADISAHLSANSITTSLRHNRAGEPLLRFSPHFYNTEAEMDRVAQVIGEAA
ncbi:aminotransferase class V-fold PLP-dependent enzyme [Prosthecobacter sp.]|uniref:aminotransferase class V-fold PLP-dependent enzyme n=1 Tax=Prosthecobacter sp. TaxID=1965333 RepID=UPI002489935B|nr:aminotransferase class V-fold PLP-dependent enzyme [Prosthecobacter sp.]MDI1314181.1 aminotransferase class V-fold PLP-dependent enzyme [Prosthecobacter sp.]